MNKICRLCFQTINGNYETIGQSFNDILKMNMNICKEAVKCIECTNNLEMFIKFKSACDYMSERTLTTDLKDDINLDPDKMEITNSLMSLLEPKNEVKCCFCKKTRGRESLTSLNESKEHTFLVNVLKDHIPKLNLNITEELLTCAICFDGLQTVLSFLIKCLDVEQKISQYIEIKGTDDKGQIELEDAQQFIFDPTIKIEVDSKDVTELKEECTMQAEAEIKHEEETQDIQKLIMNPTIKFEIKSKDGNELRERHDRFQEGHAIQTEANIKYEKEIENIELSIKAEEIDIKSDQSDCDSLQEVPSKFLGKEKKCEIQEELVYKNSEGITMYKCDTCSYETKHKYYLRSHKMTHKSSTEMAMLKCELCPHETKLPEYLRRHKLTHNSTSELTLFKCELCSYKGKHMNYLKKHKLTHKGPSKLKFKCEFCSYGAKRIDHLKLHKLTHKSTSEIIMSKCELCPYESKRRQCLERHKLTHKSTSELTMFRCEFCPYETKRMDHLKLHELIHKGCSDITMFKCEVCPFETKRRDNLKRHTSTHKILHN